MVIWPLNDVDEKDKMTVLSVVEVKIKENGLAASPNDPRGFRKKTLFEKMAEGANAEELDNLLNFKTL